MYHAITTLIEDADDGVCVEVFQIFWFFLSRIEILKKLITSLNHCEGETTRIAIRNGFVQQSIVAEQCR